MIDLKKLCKSEYALRNNIDNIPDDTQLHNLEYLYSEVLSPLGDYFGNDIFFNSVFRNKQVNDGVGSTDRSLHLIGAAADIDSNTIPLLEILSWIETNLLFTELIAEYFPTGWVHVGIIKGREKEKTIKIISKDIKKVSSMAEIYKLYM